VLSWKQLKKKLCHLPTRDGEEGHEDLELMFSGHFFEVRWRTLDESCQEEHCGGLSCVA
jgi:hypothetical protein